MKKRCFTVDTTIYPAKILVLSLHTKEEALKELKKHKYGKEMIDIVASDDFDPRYYGGAYRALNENTQEYLVVLLKADSQDEMDELLVHETNHITHFIATRHGFLEEMEATAYLQEYIYKEIKKGLK